MNETANSDTSCFSPVAEGRSCHRVISRANRTIEAAWPSRRRCHPALLAYFQGLTVVAGVDRVNGFALGHPTERLVTLFVGTTPRGDARRLGEREVVEMRPILAAISLPDNTSPAMPNRWPTVPVPRRNTPYAHLPMSAAAMPGSFTPPSLRPAGPSRGSRRPPWPPTVHRQK